VNYAKSENVIKKCACNTEDCKDYANLIVENSKNKGINPILVLSVMIQENNCRDSPGDRGDSIGLMQIGKDTFDEFCKKNDYSFEDFKNENKASENIKCGTEILSKRYIKYGKISGGKKYSCPKGEDILYFGWEAALRGYNGWNTNCIFGNNYYVEEIMRIFNLLKGANLGDVDQNIFEGYSSENARDSSGT
jgi:hypothetical protein